MCEKRQHSPCAGWPMTHDLHESNARCIVDADVAASRKAYFSKLSIRIERVMTDNGSCYRSRSFRAACKRLGLSRIFTKPYTPRTNGKAERFIQTALREWAYARAYQNWDQRSAELSNWLHRYNWHRPHGSLKALHAYQSPRSIRGQPVGALARLSAPDIGTSG
jgi:transposase InsO family protein